MVAIAHVLDDDACVWMCTLSCEWRLKDLAAAQHNHKPVALLDGGADPEVCRDEGLTPAGAVLDSGVIAAKVQMGALEGHNMALKPSSCVRVGAVYGFTGGTALWSSPAERDREKELIDAVTSEVQRAEMDGHLLVWSRFLELAEEALRSAKDLAVFEKEVAEAVRISSDKRRSLASWTSWLGSANSSGCSALVAPLLEVPLSDGAM
ncbi:hypothetical protein CYMTET_14173 [Cymbomonas tetramitiformis]|uniref:Uncharacterized protein n=1 Tax=Cymbomonas tetramitiformis TaxID=36881 RepID=A0AAE0LA62_9CHLO|nr:hypothetical protein CYMTET_14173 [Cymbomonas tetramitiformis]